MSYRAESMRQLIRFSTSRRYSHGLTKGTAIKEVCTSHRFKPSSGSQKSSFFGTRIFHLCPQDTTSFDRRSTSFRAKREHHSAFMRTQNDVALHANEVAASRKWCDASHQWCCASRKRKVSSTKALDFGGLFVFLGIKTPPFHHCTFPPTLWTWTWDHQKIYWIILVCMI